MDGPHRRVTLYDQIVAVDGSRRSAGFTLDELLSDDKVSAPAPAPALSPAPAAQLANRTLSDIIRDNEPKGGLVSQRDRRSWNLFKDRIRLKRAAAALSNSLSIPTSDIPLNNSRTDPVPSGSVRRTNLAELINETARPEESSISGPSSNRFGPPESTQSNDMSASTITGPGSAQIRISSSTDATDQAREGTRRLSASLAEERALSDREAAAAQTAVVQGAFVVAVEQAVSPVRMSLLDLLEETERPIGGELGPARYVGIVGEVKEEEEEVEGKNNGGMRERESLSEGQNCCVCMVRNKGAAFIPCGHTFCRLCSREVWVSRGNCPLCNGFILEILDIF